MKPEGSGLRTRSQRPEAGSQKLSNESTKAARRALITLSISVRPPLNDLRQAYRLLQNFDELGDCRLYLGLFFPNREQFELNLCFS